MSIKHPARWRRSRTITGLRAPSSGPLARVRVTSLHASVSGSRQVRPWSWSTKPALGGDWRSRDLTKTGEACWVVAPSVMPKQAGARVTTARRDAGPLARLRRSGDLTPVYVPPVEDEALRARSRARDDTLRDRQAATCRLHAFLLRPELRSDGPGHLGAGPPARALGGGLSSPRSANSRSRIRPGYP